MNSNDRWPGALLEFAVLTPTYGSEITLPAQPFFATPAQRLAWARQQFFERGEPPRGLVPQALIQSWQRCVRAGREGREHLEFEPVSALRLDTALRRSRALREAADASFQHLQTALGSTGCRLLLTDAEGMIVRLSAGVERAEQSAMPQLTRLRRHRPLSSAADLEPR